MCEPSSNSDILPRKRHVILSAERNVIYNVIKACTLEKQQHGLDIPLNVPLKRAAFYTGVPERTLKRIRTEAKVSPQGARLPSPKKRPGRPKFEVDGFDRNGVCRILMDFYKAKGQIPTVRKFLAEAKAAINFPYGKDTLIKVFKELGFKWKKTKGNKKLLIERPGIIMWRHKYLNEITGFRKEGRKIFYLDETWISEDLSMGKCWQGPGVFGSRNVSSSKKKFIIAGIGSEDGFLPGTKLMFQAGTSPEEENGPMNFDNFTKWITLFVLPQLPQGSVVVMDYAPYHTEQVDKPPSYSTKKSEIIDWLTRRGVLANAYSRKAYLMELVSANKPRQKTYKIDHLFEALGHQIVRLPPYLYEFSPIQLAWVKMKKFFTENPLPGEVPTKELEKHIIQGFESITSADWKGFCRQVQKIEDEYWERDGIMEDALDDLDVNNDYYGSSCEEEYSSDSEEDIDT